MFYFRDNQTGHTTAVCGDDISHARNVFLKSVGKPDASFILGSQITIHHEASGKEMAVDIVEG